ncbi:nucleotidyltransferase family protein [Methanopyrus sp.]
MRVAACVLAAGRSTRFREALEERGEEPVSKLVYPVAGKPMVAWVVERASRAADEILVGLGYDAGLVWDVVRRRATVPVRPILNDPVDVPMACTAANLLRRSDADVGLILAGDQPTVTTETMRRLAEAAAEHGASILDRGAPAEEISGDDLLGHGPPLALRKDVIPEFLETIEELAIDTRGPNALNLNPVLRECGLTFRAVPPRDNAELLNVNTPEEIPEVERALLRSD